MDRFRNAYSRLALAAGGGKVGWGITAASANGRAATANGRTCRRPWTLKKADSGKLGDKNIPHPVAIVLDDIARRLVFQLQRPCTAEKCVPAKERQLRLIRVFSRNAACRMNSFRCCWYNRPRRMLQSLAEYEPPHRSPSMGGFLVAALPRPMCPRQSIPGTPRLSSPLAPMTLAASRLGLSRTTSLRCGILTGGDPAALRSPRERRREAPFPPRAQRSNYQPIKKSMHYEDIRASPKIAGPRAACEECGFMPASFPSQSNTTAPSALTACSMRSRPSTTRRLNVYQLNLLR